MEDKRYLDQWILKKIGSKAPALTREELEAYQYRKLMETLHYVKEHSSFYGELLKDFDVSDIRSLEDLRRIPFTTVNDLSEDPARMQCVPTGDIKRIVSMETSGSTGASKRIFFTEEDQELTIDHFHNGMYLLSDPTDVVLVLLPCQRPGSVGDLLRIGIERMGARAVAYGLVDDTEKVLDLMEEKKVTVIVGVPGQLLALAQKDVERAGREGTLTGSSVKSILLSTDYIPDEICASLHDIWGSQVFEHYGMTEMGLGCAVSCPVLEGYHIREGDLLLEIVDPDTLEPVPEGEYGEIVFTTLTRKAMPFVRYRTGDRSRFLPDSCPCGSVLKRLEKVGKREALKQYQGGDIL